MHLAHNNGMLFGPWRLSEQMPGNARPRDRARTRMSALSSVAFRALTLPAIQGVPRPDTGTSHVAESTITPVSQTDLTVAIGAAPAIGSDTEDWAAVPERVATNYSLYEAAHSAAQEADRAGAMALDALDRASHPFIALVAHFVERFETAPFTLNWEALNGFLDEQGVAPLHGNAATPLVRVMQAFKTKETKAPLVGKRAATLAGLRLAKVPAAGVEEALSKPAKQVSGRPGKSGMDRFVDLFRKSRQSASVANSEVEMTDKPEVAPAVEPEIQPSEQTFATAAPHWMHEIEGMIGQGNVSVRFDDRLLQIVGMEAAGLKITLHASGPFGG